LVDAEAYIAATFGTTDTFTDLADIVKQLKAKVAPHYDPTGKCGKCIEDLAIWGHGGAPGYITFGPEDAQTAKGPTGDTDPNLAALGALMCTDGRVVINQCKAGEGTDGTKSLQALANKIGVPVSGPTDSIKGCRGFGGLFTTYKEVKPDPNARTPAQNKEGPVESH
jgi:hypothetical protein